MYKTDLKQIITNIDKFQKDKYYTVNRSNFLKKFTFGKRKDITLLKLELKYLNSL